MEGGMDFISLFSGIGGLDLGLERAGMTCVAQVENNPFCKQVLTKHWPNVPKYEDVKNVGKSNLPAADLICGGFPCQPHSLAGKRKASGDDRDLWPEFARIVSECQPEWVLAENVPGLLSSEAGRFFGRILADLAASRYSIEWQSLPAAAFGAPHIRERIFIVAHNESFRKRRLSISERRSPQENIDTDRVCENLSNTKKQQRPFDGQEASKFGWVCKDVSYPNNRCSKRETQSLCTRRDVIKSGCENISNSNSERQQMQWQPIYTQKEYEQSKSKCGVQWEVEPGMGRVVDGFPGRVDRLRGLGNAVVPQVAEFVGKCIMNFDINGGAK